MRAMRPALALLLLLLAACPDEPPKPPGPLDGPSDAERAIRAHAEAQFGEAEVRTVAPGVHVAIGFGLANAILLEGEGGAVVVDTLGTLDSAARAKAALRNESEAPIRALVLTHNHADHVFGAQAFLEGEPPGAKVYAHASLGALVDRVVSDIRPIVYARSMRMFGHPLPKARHLGCGIGPALDHDPGRLGFVRPTHTLEDRLEVEVAGLRLVLEHAPGETDDQIFVWLPDKKVLLPGDNFYHAFPNLYTIRGTPHRDLKKWVASLDRMRALEPEVLVPSHTQPILGKEAVLQALTDYRDAIQYVHDQTVRGMNRGLSPEQLAATVRLPEHLARAPYLQERYGTVAWSVRSVFAGYMGWFDGDPTHLEPLTVRARAERMKALLPKGATLEAAAAEALEREDWQWAAELFELARALEPDAPSAKAGLARAFTALGRRHPSPNGRNYYLTRAAELRGEVEVSQPDLSRVPAASLEHLPAWRFLASMPVFLDAEQARDVELVAAFRFTDAEQAYAVTVRRGVAIFSRGAPPSADFTLVTDGETWKGIVLGRINPAKAALDGRLEVDGDLARLVTFLGLFDKP